ncbi:MAG: arginine decarboxylase [Chitinophagaceae bacterium]|mgnify:FL=1|jgi:arginine decarboxylase|nr:arginine decarboxylase [Chitinophagaceae bacterium]MBP6046322.1 arginine decarboxylase [Ferruginibacter sp.]MBK7347114.1 arginine decarboxylase [Chitinophagaceae bacterium]MBK7733781.1 arginine decarboxylase [Chitinophagaceae bacterium]MBK8774695.1 arginine decarboxylase [Chitinophagaceae bacterium]
MNNTYNDLVQQTFNFPQDDLKVKDNYLQFNNIDLKLLIDKYGTPLKMSFLPKIGWQINKAKKMFADAIKKNKYEGKYNYCYCTKSSHFSFVLEEAIKHNIHLETSYAYDIEIINSLYKRRKINKDIFILCNGFKQKNYTSRIARLINTGFRNVIPILDNKEELNMYKRSIRTKEPFKLGIRIAAEEEPTFPFYTSRLGIKAKDVLEYYVDEIEGNEDKFQLKMLHIFLNKGIKDDIYYWSELQKSINLYCQLKKICPELDSINIGGGFPIKHSLAFNYDYQFMINEIVSTIKKACKKARVQMPHIFTEFGSYTVGESMAHIYSVIGQKVQNDRETWYMIDSSFITTLPDTWGIGEKFLMLPINKWNNEYQRVVLGGITCDGHDYYDSEEHINEVFLPKLNNTNGDMENNKEPLYVGFFHTGAYQDQISGYGGIKHCLIPSPKHIIVDFDKNGKLTDWVYAKEQTAQSMLKILGY